MGTDNGNPTDRSAGGSGAHDRDPQERKLRQEREQQRQQQDLEEHRGHPSAQEEQVRREQGGHDRPVGPDQVPHRRPENVSPDDREVGDLDAPDAVDQDGALPGRAGGGLAGG